MTAHDVLAIIAGIYAFTLVVGIPALLWWTKRIG